MHLLVAVDFSPHSEAALDHGCALAACLGATPLVLHVVHDPAEMPGYYAKQLLKRKRLERIDDLAREMLERFIASAAENHRSIAACPQIETELVCGLPGTRIVEVAHDHQVKMIIMGSRGHNGLKRLMLGSVAAQVVRLSPCPVTVVKR